MDIVVKNKAIKILSNCKKHFEDILQEYVGIEIYKVPAELRETAELLVEVDSILEEIEKNSSILK